MADARTDFSAEEKDALKQLDQASSRSNGLEFAAIMRQQGGACDQAKIASDWIDTKSDDHLYHHYLTYDARNDSGMHHDSAMVHLSIVRDAGYQISFPFWGIDVSPYSCPLVQPEKAK